MTMDGWRREFDWMRYSKAVVVLPIITLIAGLVLAFALPKLNKNFLNSKTIPDEDERQKSRRRRHHHHHENKYKRRIGSTRRHKNSSRDIITSEKRRFPHQQDQSSYYYFRYSGVRQFLSSVKQFISFPMSTISLLSPWHEQECSSNHRHRSWHSTRLSTTQTPLSQNSAMENYYHDAIVVGLDCEMVGGGRGGWKSLLARCSVVTLDRVPQNYDKPSSCHDQITSLKVSLNTEHHPQAKGQQQSNNLNRLDEDLIVLYDKYVVPKGKITDYRTEWSGITKETYSQSSQQSPIPIVSFNQCQNEIAQLLSSIHGRRVVVVGHALENDFEALEIDYPPSLLRDTAFFRPYMRESRRKMYPRKLSVLTKEELGIEIQQKMQGGPVTSQISSAIGHSSVEDAAASLRLYWHKFTEWEQSLGYPLTMTQQSISRFHTPLQMYLDGCNLPIGCRGANFKELLMETYESGTNGADNKKRTLSSETFRLTSRKRVDIHSPNVSTIDWIPAFQSALSPHSIPKFRTISVMFDGAKFDNILGKESQNSFETRTFSVDSSTLSESENIGTINIHITNNGDSTDDVLVHVTCRTEVSSANDASSDSKRIVSLDKTVEILSNSNNIETDVLPYYIVVRRKAGGTKTHRKLFDKLHLRRANEGALCLAALTTSLKKHSLKIARELQREKSIEKVIECELRDRCELRSIVVTDDVYLTDRLVRGNAVLVLSFQQLLHLW